MVLVILHNFYIIYFSFFFRLPGSEFDTIFQVYKNTNPVCGGVGGFRGWQGEQREGQQQRTGHAPRPPHHCPPFARARAFLQQHKFIFKNITQCFGFWIDSSAKEEAFSALAVSKLKSTLPCCLSMA